MELYQRTTSNLRLRLLSPLLLANIKATNADWRSMKSLKDWELVTRNTSTPVTEANCFDTEAPKPREIWEILDWILWENGNFVETACAYPIGNFIWTERPFEVVLEELCLVAYTLHKERLKRDSPFLQELAGEIRIYFMKLYAIHTSGYKEDAIPLTDEGLAILGESEMNKFMQKNNLHFESLY